MCKRLCVYVCGCVGVCVGRGKGGCGLDLGLCLDLVCSGTAEKDKETKEEIKIVSSTYCMSIINNF